MDIVAIVVGVLFFGAGLWALGSAARRSTRRMNPVADDLRRSGDGQPDQRVVDYGSDLG